ncbi:MAG: DUF2330 domain-containing protein [Myxococcota bacterium]
MAAPGERVASACGGTFCDAGPTAMPVEQTGETIVFAVDDTHVEAHIQIAYDPETEASQFAWVVPVTALPEFSVGSQDFIARLLDASVPSYGRSNWNEPCGSADDGDFDDSCDGGAGEGGDAEGERFDIGSGPDGGAEPEVVLSETVGAFEVYVLDGGTAQGVMDWLSANDFQQDEAATPILEEYLAEGHLFVAFRLATDAEASEIHPIVLRYEGQAPCVPIRLTRIAAQDDLEIRTLFLGDHRFASSNYPQVTLNRLKIDWMNSGTNYREVVSMALDEPGADGHGFITEYAGPSDIVSSDGLLGEAWDPMPFTMAETPGLAVELLLDQQLVHDWTGICEGQHPLVAGLVAQHLPTPPDVPFSDLCDDPLGFANTVDPEAWDGAAFAADFEARIIVPTVHAIELLDTWPYLTRLYTLLSPHEMTVDPMFHATPEQPESTSLTLQGSRNRFCDGHTTFEVPGGRLVHLPQQNLWPDILPELMPWAERIEFLPAAGAPIVEVDNTESIEGVLAAWHEQVGDPRPRSSMACGDESDSGQVPTTSSGGPGADAIDGGCGCRSSDSAPLGLAVFALTLLGLRRRE